MKANLTITLEKGIIEQAKIYAKERGGTLSELIESYLKDVLDGNKKDANTKALVKKLKASAKSPDTVDHKKELTKIISQMYYY